MAVIFYSFIVQLMIQFYEIHTLSVESTRNGTGLINANDTLIICSYTQENVLKIEHVSVSAFNRSSILFEPIATFIPNLNSVFTPQGQYLKGRVTLTNIKTSSTKAVMIFNKLLCVDATIYTCTVSYIASSGLPGKTTSNNISISVQVQVRMPTIQLYPNKTDYVVGEDSSIHFICKTNGNPKPNYQWYKENTDKPINDSENFTITDLNRTDSGIYTCNVSNTFNSNIYKNAANVQINIRNKADISTTQSSSTLNSSDDDKKEKKSNEDLGLVIGIVVAVVTVIVVIIVIIACKRRKCKFPTFKNLSNNFDYSKPKPVTESRTGDYDYIALEDDPPKPKSSNNGLEVEDITKHNAEYLKKEEEEKKKNESNTPPQPAVYALVNEATKSKTKQKTEAIDSVGKQEEDTYAETQEGIYDKAGDRRHKEKENTEHYDSSTNSSKQNSNGDSKLAIQTSRVGSYANQGFEKDENRKVATVSPTVRSSGGSQNDEQIQIVTANPKKVTKIL